VKSLVSCAEALRLDSATSSIADLQPILLMEDASLLLWQALAPLAAKLGAGSSSLLLAVCGPGGNGGDALAALRHARFSGLRRVAAILAKAPGELASIHAASLRALGLPVLDWTSERGACEALIAEAGLIIDGLAGTGLSGPLHGPQASIVAAMNATAESGRARIASIDLPSGLSDHNEPAWPIVRASWTLSVEPRKACLYLPPAREACGLIIGIEGVFPSDADIAEEASLLEAGDLRALSPLPPGSSYKGTRGRVAVFAGSVGASGAALLCSRACLASGAGLAALYASPETYQSASASLASVMVKHEDFAHFEPERWDSLLVGPGWGRTEARRGELASLLETGLPAVLDADAIHLYRELYDSGFRARSPIILTPHPGEFAALRDERALVGAWPRILADTAQKFQAVIVLKSHVTWIASPKVDSSVELAVWEGLDPGLATAGSGDVLAGLVAGLLGREAARAPGRALGLADAYRAARAAVIAHGLAGRAARASMGWFEAEALIGEAGKALGLQA
jgi:ADP-dependent NAD(P)H-hydrate dehydratase / NAD(P)H-hydrate epimerase